MPELIWGLVEERAPKTPGGDRSGYIRNLVEADLKANGALVEAGDKRAERLALHEEAEANGIDVEDLITRAIRRKKHAA